MKTKNYKYYEYPFKDFNPVQDEVLEVLKKSNDRNLVLSANTSAGKTICAEFLIDQTLKKNKKVLYLSPLKALADEKFKEWSERFKDEELAIITSDYSTNIIQKLDSSSILIMTSEMLDSKSRNYNPEKSTWLDGVGLLIVDESHIISSESRGAAVEVSILRFTLRNKKSRIMLLSATMSNCLDFQNWLMMLNGKKTDVVESAWRPVELSIHYRSYDVAIKNSEYSGFLTDYFKTEENKIEAAISIILEKVDKEKFLVFVHSKATGRKVVRKLDEMGVYSIFHNADLKRESRRQIEEEFKSKDGKLRVLVSTSTLAWGVNLPARNVVIVGTDRGTEEVDSLDIIQMAGRAGRYGIDDHGDVYLIVLSSQMSKWKSMFENPRPLLSKLESPEVLLFHVLAEINNGVINDEFSLRKWYRKTLRYLQVMRIPLSISSTIIPLLQKLFMITVDTPLTTTKLGEISSMLYFSPYDVSGWYYNFKDLVKVKDPNDYHLSLAFFDVRKNRTWIPKELVEVLNDFKGESRRSGVSCDKTKSLLHVYVSYICLSGEQVRIKSGILNMIKGVMISDFERVALAIKLIVGTFAYSHNKEETLNVINSTELRIKYGIPVEAIELVKIPLVGTKRALELMDENMYTAKDIVNPKNKKKLLRIFSPRVAKTIFMNSKRYLRAR